MSEKQPDIKVLQNCKHKYDQATVNLKFGKRPKESYTFTWQVCRKCLVLKGFTATTIQQNNQP